MPALSKAHYMSALCLCPLLFIPFCYLALRREPSLQAHFSITVIDKPNNWKEPEKKNEMKRLNVFHKLHWSTLSIIWRSLITFQPEQHLNTFPPLLNNLQIDTVMLINMDIPAAWYVSLERKSPTAAWYVQRNVSSRTRAWTHVTICLSKADADAASLVGRRRRDGYRRG